MKATALSIGVILGLIFAASNAFAFSKERCGKLFPKAESSHPPYYSPLYISTMVPSTTSYFSSVGPCSMYGSDNPSARRAFIEESIAQIQTDAARGQGDYLNALAELSGCPASQFDTFASTVHSNFNDLFLTGDAKALMGKLDSTLRQHAILKNSCVL